MSFERFEQEQNLERAVERQQLDKLYEYARAREAAGGRIRESDFENYYGPDAVAKDRDYVELRKRQFSESLARLPEGERGDAEEARKLSYVMEMMLQEEGELSEWFGRDAHTAMASEYDDIKNGVDAIVEFETETGAEYLALAVDFTLKRGSLDKIQRIKEDIDGGRTTEVKYFYSEYEKKQKPLKDLAKVVVTCDTSTLLEAAHLWKTKGRSPQAQRALANHPIQLIILREIQSQLEAYRAYAEKTGKVNFETMYAGDLAMIDAILGEKEGRADTLLNEKEGRILGNPTSDDAYRALARNLSVVFGK
ncbi:MAG: hypothetical protein HYT22_03805 [Candidatus Niyogibacteria bacterium]|nr:hypothetical protein [Candidatus Niyogibacteria bacterium]